MGAVPVTASLFAAVYRKGDLQMDTVLSIIIEKMLSVLWRILSTIGSFFSSPKIEIPTQKIGYGRTDNRQFALFVTVRFRNESERDFLVRSLQAEYRGVWYDPLEDLPSLVRLLGKDGWQVPSFSREENIMKAPQIPRRNVAERVALFHLPDPGKEMPETLEFTVKVTFSFGKSRVIGTKSGKQ